MNLQITCLNRSMYLILIFFLRIHFAYTFLYILYIHIFVYTNNLTIVSHFQIIFSNVKNCNRLKTRLPRQRIRQQNTFTNRFTDSRRLHPSSSIHTLGHQSIAKRPDILAVWIFFEAAAMLDKQ